jgi:hypothetical protein
MAPLQAEARPRANASPQRPPGGLVRSTMALARVIHRLSTHICTGYPQVSECSHTGTEGVTCGTRVHYHTRARTYARVCAYVRVRARTYARVCAYVRVRVRTCVRVRAYVCVCVRVCPPQPQECE